jgi:lysophospholipase L1-like esterase|nr:MAG TPA_asm: GDSL-like Lipase/Acylhydrolase [Caudoviricetes sp.]
MTEKDLGQIIPDILATATVDNKVGEPAVNVTVEQINEVNRLERKFNFEFVNMKGEKGDTPVKGVDYLTEEEKEQFTTETLSLVTAEGTKQVKAVTDKGSEQTSLVIAEGNKQISLTQTEALKVIEQLKSLIAGSPSTSNAQALSGKTRVEFEQDIEKVDTELKTVTGIHNIIHPKWTKGKRIDETGNIISAGNTIGITDEIPVIYTDIQRVIGIRSGKEVNAPSIHYYDESHQHIAFKYFDSSDGDEIYDLNKDIYSNKAKYIRFVHVINSRYPFENVKIEFITKGREDVLEDDVKKLKVDNNVSRSTQYVNLLEGYTESVNKKILSNGVLLDHPNWCSTINYIPVKPDTVYTIKFAGEVNSYPNIKVEFYDIEKKYLSSDMGVTYKDYTTPSNCKYIRISTTNTASGEHRHDNFNTAFLQETNRNSIVTLTNESFNTKTFPRTNLLGKKWALFGDSITEKNFRSNVNYHDYIRSETGIITINNGVGGSGYKNRDDNNNAFYQIARKTIDTWRNADLITIMGGVNDMWGQVTTNGLGTYKDEFVEPENIEVHTNNTLMSCFNYTLDYVIKNAPDTRVAVISPLPCFTTQNQKKYSEIPSDENCNMHKFVEECKKACSLRGVPYLDLFHNSGLRPWDTNFNAKYFKTNSSDSPDGLHPNEYGHKWIYPMIREFLKTLL